MRDSNYEIMKRDAQKLFLNYDQQRMIEKFNLEHDPAHLYLEFVAARYRISRSTGVIERLAAPGAAAAVPRAEENASAKELHRQPAISSQDKASAARHVWHEAGFDEAMSIFDVLCWSKDGCSLSGNYCDINNVKGASFAAAPGNDMFAPEARIFDRQSARLAAACEALGGRQTGIGDVSYILPLFPFLSVWLQFWESDEDFPPQLKFKWDENILQYMHFETTFYVTGHVIRRLKELLPAA